MKRYCLLLAALVVALSPFAVVADEASDKAELVRIEKAFADVLTSNDGEAFAATLAPDWKLVIANGTVMNREELVTMMKSGKLKFNHYEVDQLEVRVYGDAAVVIGVDKAKGRWESEPFTTRERFTDVFIRKDGKWLCVSSHSSELSGE